MKYDIEDVIRMRALLKELSFYDREQHAVTVEEKLRTLILAEVTVDEVKKKVTELIDSIDQRIDAHVESVKKRDPTVILPLDFREQVIKSVSWELWDKI